MARVQPRFSRLLITNIPGSGWDGSPDNSFSKNFVEQAREKYGVGAGFWAVRDAILEIAREENISFSSEKAHVASTDLKRALRRAAFENITRQISSEQKLLSVVESRAIYYSPEGVDEPSLSDGEIRLLNPDIVVTVIDDVVVIRDRLRTHKDTIKYQGLSIVDLVRWLELEFDRAKALARTVNRPFFVIPRKQLSALLDIVFTDKEPVYASYPMSNLPESHKKKVFQFVKKLRRYFIVFDPACMGTAHIEGKDWTSQELQSYRRNVIKRDIEWFIQNNSKRVIVYAPQNVQMAGSQSELDNAFHQGKENWVVLEPSLTDSRGKLTPFLDQHAELVFVSSGEFFEFLDLPVEEQRLYGKVLKAMWDFKRIGRLSQLREKDLADGTASEADGQIEYGNFVNTFLGLAGRDSPVSREKLERLRGMCWKHNRQLIFQEDRETRQLELEVPGIGERQEVEVDALGKVTARRIKEALRRYCMEKKLGIEEAYYLEDQISLPEGSVAAARTKQLEQFFENTLSDYRRKKRHNN